MAESKILRFSPSRNDVQAAQAWRIWVQGNEFYAAARSAAEQMKISFHCDPNRWQLRVAQALHRLARPRIVSTDWLQAIRVVFLIDEGVLLPLEQRNNQVQLLDVPVDNQLTVDLMISVARAPKPFALLPGTTLLGQFSLRDGRRLAVISAVAPFTEIDRALIADYRKNLWAGYHRPVATHEVYLEGTEFFFDAKTGNKIAVVPVGFDSIGVELA